MSNKVLIKGGQNVLIDSLPFLQRVEGLVSRFIRNRVTEKSPNSFLYIASDGKRTSLGMAGQENALAEGLIQILSKNEKIRTIIINYFIQNQDQNEESTEQ